ncbi:MAG TPA: hypothetical protein VG329_04370 [Candidatus Dormibacteraeota bacterium]|jgi:hypothetical protein|nr:hypothetical protein [Candidatus Dormibacteraeota bacterium]
MEDARREILSQVAAGTLTPAEAASRLDEVERSQADPPGRIPTSAAADIRGVRVRSDYGRIIVLGDASVDQAVVEGPHVARSENGILEIETDPNSEGDFWFGRRDGGHWWDSFRGPTVTVRMNPRLEAWINADAGSATVRNVLGPIHAEVQAGSLVLQGFAGPLDLAASAGSIRAEGSLREGSSRIRCEMGSVRLTLSPDSDVRVVAATEMGKVNIDDGTQARGRGRSWGGRQEVVYGSGTATLEIESQMGSIVVSRSS